MSERKNDAVHDMWTADDDDDDDYFTWFFERVIQTFWQDAMRAALDCQDAARSCGRRSCRQADSCQMTCQPGVPLVCDGGRIDEAIPLAAFGVIFGCQMIADPKRPRI